jgi:hypothetical protein
MLDEYHKDSFTLRANIFVTINNYSALFILPTNNRGRHDSAIPDKLQQAPLAYPVVM